MRAKFRTEIARESADLSSPSETLSGGVTALPRMRWAGLTALLMAEALGLGVRFEGVQSSFAGHRWWSELLAQAHAFFDVFVLSAGAALLFGGAALADEFRRLSLRAAASRSVFRALLVIHLAVFGGFAWLTGVVWEGGVEIISLPRPGAGPRPGD